MKVCLWLLYSLQSSPRPNCCSLVCSYQCLGIGSMICWWLVPSAHYARYLIHWIRSGAGWADLHGHSADKSHYQSCFWRGHEDQVGINMSKQTDIFTKELLVTISTWWFNWRCLNTSVRMVINLQPIASIVPSSLLWLLTFHSLSICARTQKD